MKNNQRKLEEKVMEKILRNLKKILQEKKTEKL